MALERGWAINFSGGYHHASCSNGGGFCIYPDITLCVRFLKKYKPSRVKKVMIIDLDAHQGNGYEKDFIGDEEKTTYIIDMFNPYIYPGDDYAKQAINYYI